MIAIGAMQWEHPGHPKHRSIFTRLHDRLVHNIRLFLTQPHQG